MENVLKLKNINLYKIKNASFTDIMFRANELISGHTAITTAMPAVTAQFNALVEKLNKTLVAEKGSVQTQRMQEFDAVRDDAHRGLHLYVKANTYHPDNSISDAAKEVIRVIERFGVGELRRASYADESALLMRLMEELSSSEIADAKSKLGEINNWTSALDVAMSDFEEVMNERFAENENSLGYTTFDVRKEIIPVFKNMMQAIETFAMLNTDPAYGAFLTEINARIDYLNL